MSTVHGEGGCNPSLSDFMAQYMKALKRRKVSIDCTLFLIKWFKMSLLISCFLGAGRRTIRKRQSDNFAKDPRVVRVQHEDPVFDPARAPPTVH